nr:hypothetical protein P413_06 [uncultured bacterium]
MASRQGLASGSAPQTQAGGDKALEINGEAEGANSGAALDERSVAAHDTVWPMGWHADRILTC